MNFKIIKSSIVILRPLNILIAGVSVSVAVVLAGAQSTQWFEILLAGITASIVAGGANTINDVFDIEIDRINKPNRPLPSGSISIKTARVIWGTLSLIAIVLNIFLNVASLSVVLISILLLYYYSAYFKRTILMGNLIVAFMTGLAFLYGGVVVSHLEQSVYPALFAFFVNFAREIIKDIEDMGGDRAEGAVTFPIRYGIIPPLVITTIVLLVLIGITILASITRFYTIWFLYLVIPVDVTILLICVFMWVNKTTKNYNRISYILKLSMIGGLVAIIGGSL